MTTGSGCQCGSSCMSAHSLQLAPVAPLVVGLNSVDLRQFEDQTDYAVRAEAFSRVHTTLLPTATARQLAPLVYNFVYFCAHSELALRIELFDDEVETLSLFDPLFSVMGPQAASYRASGRLRSRTGSRSTTAAPRNAYRTGDDRWVCLSASTQAMAERVLRTMARPCTLPALTCVPVGTIASMSTGTWPPSTSRKAGATPL